MHELQREVSRVHARLDAICDALDRIEENLRPAVRDSKEARSEAHHAFKTAGEAAHKVRFLDKRVDALVSRVQSVENGQR